MTSTGAEVLARKSGINPRHSPASIHLLQKLLDHANIPPCFLLVLDGLVEVEVEVTPLGETTSKVTATIPSDQLHVHAPR